MTRVMPGPRPADRGPGSEGRLLEVPARACHTHRIRLARCRRPYGDAHHEQRHSSICSATRPPTSSNTSARPCRRTCCTCPARISSTGSGRCPTGTNRVLGNMQRLYATGRLAGTGYLSILPVDQGIEHSGGASFAKNPIYFDSENIVKLAIEGGCNAVASTFGVLGVGGAQVRAQDPVHREDQPQRAADLPEQGRPDHVRRRRAGGRHGRGRGGRDDLLRVGRKRPPDRRGRPGVRAGARAGPGHGALVLPAQPRVQEGQGLPRQRRPDRPGQPPRRDDPGRHHQAEAAREQRRLQGAQHRRLELRQARRAHLHAAHDRSPDRSHALPGGELLHGPRGPHQLRRRVGQERLRRRGGHGGHQQARRRHGPDLGPQGVPAPDGRRRQAAEHHPGRVPGYSITVA